MQTLEDNVAPENLDDTQVAADTRLDHDKVRRLIETQYNGLMSLVSRRLRDRELAADLVNEAIKISLEHSRSGRLTDLDRIGGYVFKVSMNLLRNHRRHHDNRLDIRTEPEKLATLSIRDGDSIEISQLGRQALELIRSLASARDREVIKRFYLEEEDKETICRSMNLTPLQFTQVTSRARQRMKQHFEAQGLKRSDFFSILI